MINSGYKGINGISALILVIYTNFMFEFQTIYLFDVHSSILKKIMVEKIVC